MPLGPGQEIFSAPDPAPPTLRRLAARRGLAISPDEAARIDACVAADQLGLWIERALDAASMAEVFTG